MDCRCNVLIMIFYQTHHLRNRCVVIMVNNDRMELPDRTSLFNTGDDIHGYPLYLINIYDEAIFRLFVTDELLQ